jgi:hypothetical protein
MRRSIVSAVAAFAVIASSASVADAATCNQLRGKNLATNGKVKIVKTRLGKGRSRYFGCVLPRGTAHPIGRAFGLNLDGVDTSQSIDQVKGTFVVVTYSESYGTTTSDDSRVYNLATGKSYLFYNVFGSENGSDQYDLGSPVRKFLDDKGRLVASYLHLPTTDQSSDVKRVTITVFSATGKRTILDQATEALDAKSLKVVGKIASWTSGGMTKTYTLP